MQDMVTEVRGTETEKMEQNGFVGQTSERKFGLRSVTKIVKSLNAQHNSDSLTFKAVSDWLVAEGYWQKETGRLRPTEKGLENGMSMEKGCLNGKEFESVYCDRNMQTIISGKFSSFFENNSAAAGILPQDIKMSQTWEDLAAGYYDKGCFKEAADCYKKTIDCLRPQQQ